MNSRLNKHLRLIFLFTIIYIILNESFSFLTIGLGVSSAIIAILLTNKILEIDYVEMFDVNVFLVLIYFWIIIRDTYIAGFDVIVRIFKNDINPNFIEYKSELKNEFLNVLLANAITMPPGVITVDRDGNTMTVLTVGYEKEKFCEDTRNNIERLIEKFDK